MNSIVSSQIVPLHPPGGSAMAEAPVDLQARRNIADSVFNRGQIPSYDGKNTTYLLVTRSGGSTVRQLLETIHSRCIEREQGLPSSQPPVTECCILAQWAADPYYGVVISGRDGVSTILQAMRSFDSEKGMQEACTLLLANLCVASPCLAETIEREGCVARIVAAMKVYPDSTAVQAAACDALRNLNALILSKIATREGDYEELLKALSYTKEQYLLPKYRLVAAALHAAFEAQIASAC